MNIQLKTVFLDFPSDANKYILCTDEERLQ